MGTGTRIHSNFRKGLPQYFKVNVIRAGFVVFSLLLLLPSLVNGHGRLLRPPGRSSLWRFSRFQHLSPPKNYDDTQLYCGGVHQRDEPGSSCGVCGDPVSERRPRANEIGGRFYKGIITEQYKSGDVIRVEAQITAPHNGYMEWRLCTNPKWETQDCFDKHVLQIGDGTGSKVRVGGQAGTYWAKLKLPDNVSCEHCVIQWNYRAGNNWGNCGNGISRVGCGPQETFRACSDVRIVPRTGSTPVKLISAAPPPLPLPPPTAPAPAPVPEPTTTTLATVTSPRVYFPPTTATTTTLASTSTSTSLPFVLLKPVSPSPSRNTPILLKSPAVALALSLPTTASLPSTATTSSFPIQFHQKRKVELLLQKLNILDKEIGAGANKSKYISYIELRKRKPDR